MKTNAHLGASRLQTTCGLELLELLSVLAKLQRLGRLLGNLEAVLERLNLHQIVCQRPESRGCEGTSPSEVCKDVCCFLQIKSCGFMQYIGESE